MSGTWLTPTRRSVLQGATAGFMLGRFATPLFADEHAPQALADYQPTYFTAPEWAFVMAATARLIPSEGEGPGAIEARVPIFIDLQLAADFGKAADWYMEGPHQPDADPRLGYQTPLTPAQVYRQGIEAFDHWCKSAQGGSFAELAPEKQDAALTALEKNAAPAAAADGKGAAILPPELRDFFRLLLQNTKEGYFADPKYGGNHQMQAWVYIGFPGARASYTEWVGKHNVAYPLGPVSISGERA